MNRALHARQVIELIPAWDGVNVDHRHVGDPIDDALARLADPLVRELTGGHRSASGSATTTAAAGSSTTRRGRAAGAGATWRPVATGPRRPGTELGEGWRGRGGRRGRCAGSLIDHREPDAAPELARRPRGRQRSGHGRKDRRPVPSPNASPRAWSGHRSLRWHRGGRRGGADEDGPGGLVRSGRARRRRLVARRGDGLFSGVGTNAHWRSMRRSNDSP